MVTASESLTRSFIKKLGDFLIIAHNHDNIPEIITNLKYVRDSLDEVIATNFQPNPIKLLELINDTTEYNEQCLEK